MRRLALGLLLALPAAAQVPEELPARPDDLLDRPAVFASPLSRATEHVLSNGIKVVVVEDRSLPLFELVAAVPVGEVLDGPQTLGVAATAGALIRRGGAGPWTQEELDDEIELRGFVASSVAGFRRSGVTLGGLSSHLQDGVELFSAMLTAPRFEEASFERFRDDLAASLARRNDSGGAILDREWRWLMHGENGKLARQLRPADVERLRVGALREFHRRCYRPEQTVLAVSGDVEASDVVRRLEKSLGGWRAEGTCGEPPALALDPAPPGMRVIQGPGGQAQIVVGHRGIRRTSWDDGEAWALVVLDEILAGSGAVSRLGSRLRAREGLVYQVFGSFGIGSRDEGLFEVSCLTEPASAGRVIDLVAEEMERLRVQRVGDVELGLAKRSLVDSLPLLFETAEATAGRLAEDLLLERPHEYWDLYASRISAVTADDVQRVARRFLLPQALRGVVVGPAPALLRSLRQSATQAEKTVQLPERDPVHLELPAEQP